MLAPANDGNRRLRTRHLTRPVTVATPLIEESFAPPVHEGKNGDARRGEADFDRYVGHERCNMSSLSQLKQTINGLADASKRTASGLAQFDQQFNQQMQGVQQAIGGSAQNKDKEVVTALQQASKAVKAATQALQQASRVASQYGQSL